MPITKAAVKTAEIDVNAVGRVRRAATAGREVPVALGGIVRRANAADRVRKVDGAANRLDSAVILTGAKEANAAKRLLHYRR